MPRDGAIDAVGTNFAVAGSDRDSFSFPVGTSCFVARAPGASDGANCGVGDFVAIGDLLAVAIGDLLAVAIGDLLLVATGVA